MRKSPIKFVIFTLALILLYGAAISIAQQANPQMLEQKLGAVKQAAANNQAALRQYQWTESMQVTMGPIQRPPQQFTCKYGPDGTVQKTPVADAQQQQPSGLAGSKLLEAKVEQTVEQTKEYMERVQALVKQYVPPDPDKMQKAHAAGNAVVDTSTPGTAQMTFKNYVQNGDSMAFSFDEATKKMSNLNINTYLDAPADAVTVAVQFATLPDGTNYPSQTTVHAAAKNLTVTTTSSNYQKISGQ
jgi:hypothetical protein